MVVTMRFGRVSRWIYLIGAVILAAVLLLGLEWLGSEKPLMKTEVPVMQPAAKQKTG
jgi:hypothetical protein